jgi:plasmid stabilization system protein ParE
MSDDYQLIMSPEAVLDLAAIHAYILRDSPQSAARMVERILASMEKLKIVPHRTVFLRRSGKVPHPVRTLAVRPYVIYFRAIETGRVVRVLTIRHGARRRPRQFS